MNKKLFVFMSLFAFFLAGCSTPFKYSPPETTQSQGKVLVLEFQDARGEIYVSNHTLLALIPLIFYGTAETTRPELASTNFFYIRNLTRPICKEYATWIKKSLTDSNLFSQVDFVDDLNVISLDKNSSLSSYDYVLEGKILKTDLERTYYTYGLSIYHGSLFYVFGLPAMNVVYNFEIELTLKKNNGEIVWQDKIAGKGSNSMGLYYNLRANGLLEALVEKETYDQQIQFTLDSLFSTMKEHPENFQKNQ